MLTIDGNHKIQQEIEREKDVCLGGIKNNNIARNSSRTIWFCEWKQISDTGVNICMLK